MATRTVDLGSVIGPQGPKGPAGVAGAAGQRGTQWRTGTLLSGAGSTTGAYYSSSMPASLVGDMYLNTSYGYIYQCTIAGTGSAAKWTYKGRFPFLPLTGGTVTGNLRIDSGDTDTVHKLNLGDGEYVYLSEPEDDRMELHAAHLRFTGVTEASPNPLPVNQGGTGRTTPLPAPVRTARFVNATSPAGWTADDCDYLCDGAADEAEINAAIQALPAAGGEIVILDGTYAIARAIVIDKDYVTLSGNGEGTVLQRKFAGTSENWGLINVRSSYNTIQNLCFDSDGSSGVFTFGIFAGGGGHNRVLCCTIRPTDLAGGISIRGASHNIILGNRCAGKYGISAASDYNTMLGNICTNNTTAGIAITGSYNVACGNVVQGGSINQDSSGTGNIVANNAVSSS